MAENRNIERCGAWVQTVVAGKVVGERGIVTWSAPFGCMVAVALKTENMHEPFVRLTHMTGLNGLFQELAGLVGFDAVLAMAISQEGTVCGLCGESPLYAEAYGCPAGFHDCPQKQPTKE